MPRMPLALAGVVALVLAAVLYLTLGSYTWYRVVALHGAVASDTADRAEREIEQALQRMLSEIDDAGVRLVAWQEVRQQLASPAYYGYWHDQRVPTRALPGYVLDVELYDPTGLALQPQPQHPFEVQLRYRDQRPVLVRGDGRDYLMMNRAVHAPDHDEAPLGYLVMAIDLRAGIEAQGPLRYAKLDQSVTTLPITARVASSEIRNKLRFTVHSPGPAERYGALITTTFVNTAVLTLVLIARCCCSPSVTSLPRRCGDCRGTSMRSTKTRDRRPAVSPAVSRSASSRTCGVR